MNITLLRVFVPFATGYMMGCMVRTVNAVIAPDLVAEIGLSAGELGLMSSAFFLTFAAFQLPLGILLDRFGPRRTEACLMLIAAIGAAIFAASHTATGLIVGRALLGLGTSACLMAAMTAFVLWFPRDRIPMINGCQMAAGGLGAFLSTVPVALATDLIGWRGVFWVVAGFSIFAVVLIFCVVPERKADKMISGFKQQVTSIGHVFTSPLFWRIAPVSLAAQSSFIAVQSLWTGPWLRDVGGLARAEVSDYLMYIALSMIVGFLSIGTLTAQLAKFGVTTMQVAVVGITIFILIQGGIILIGSEAPGLLWAGYGFFGSVGVLGYGALSQSFPQEIAGRVVTGLNVLVFSGAFIIQWGVGLVIDQWPVTQSGGYAKEAYDIAFMVLMSIQVLAIVWYLVYKPKNSNNDL